MTDSFANGNGEKLLNIWLLINLFNGMTRAYNLLMKLKKKIDLVELILDKFTL